MVKTGAKTIPRNLADASPNARDTTNTFYHWKATDTTGSDLSVSELSRCIMPGALKEFLQAPFNGIVDEDHDKDLKRSERVVNLPGSIPKSWNMHLGCFMLGFLLSSF